VGASGMVAVGALVADGAIVAVGGGSVGRTAMVGRVDDELQATATNTRIAIKLMKVERFLFMIFLPNDLVKRMPSHCLRRWE